MAKIYAFFEKKKKKIFAGDENYDHGQIMKRIFLSVRRATKIFEKETLNRFASMCVGRSSI